MQKIKQILGFIAHKLSFHKENDTEANEFATEDLAKLPIEELFKRLESNPETGLKKTIAVKKFIEDGSNEIIFPKEEYIKQRNLLYFFKTLIMIFILFFDVALSIMLYAYISRKELTAWFTTLVVLFNVILVSSYFYIRIKIKKYDEYNDQVMRFEKAVPETAIVTRDGEKYKIKANELVVGDVVHVNKDEIVPADIKILKNDRLQVNICALMGLPQVGSEDYYSQMPTIMSLCGSYVLSGSCVGIVIRTGRNTVLTKNISAAYKKL